VFDDQESPSAVARATITGLSSSTASLVSERGGRRTVTTFDGLTHDEAVSAVLRWQSDRDAKPPSIVVHRLVHGGDAFDRARRIGPEVLATLESLVPLAPNHLPAELALVRAFMQSLPHATHVACFDTAFHRDLPDVARVLPLPSPLLHTPARRFGFHGLSYTFLLSELERLAGRAVAHGRVILAHLGSGASLAAVKDGRSVDTTMGMTPAGGLVMSTRSGDVDPGAIAYLMRAQRWSAADLDAAVTTRSGLLALSGRTGDMQQLLEREDTDAAANLAVRVFCAQAAKWMGAFAVALGGLDTIVFSGGIGEHSPVIRRRIASALSFLGVALDDDANERHAAVISAPRSTISVRVIATDESLVMAREARALLRSNEEPAP
jgi:acetate kinase